MDFSKKLLGWKVLVLCECVLAVWFLSAYLVDDFGTRFLVANNAEVFDENNRDRLLSVVVAGHWIICEKVVGSDGSSVEQCEPGFPFKQRIETAASVLKWFHRNLNDNSAEGLINPPYLFLTGAKMESQLASQYASEKLDIPSRYHLLESKSTITAENAKESFIVLEPKLHHYWNSTSSASPHNPILIVVSDTYHVLRCKILFQKNYASAIKEYGLKVMVIASESDPVQRVIGGLREIGAFAKNWVLGEFTISDVIQEWMASYLLSESKF